MLVHQEDGDWLVRLDDRTATDMSDFWWGYARADFPPAVWFGNRIAVLAGEPGVD